MGGSFFGSATFAQATYASSRLNLWKLMGQIWM